MAKIKCPVCGNELDNPQEQNICNRCGVEAPGVSYFANKNVFSYWGRAVSSAKYVYTSGQTPIEVKPELVNDEISKPNKNNTGLRILVVCGVILLLGVGGYVIQKSMNTSTPKAPKTSIKSSSVTTTTAGSTTATTTTPASIQTTAATTTDVYPIPDDIGYVEEGFVWDVEDTDHVDGKLIICGYTDDFQNYINTYSGVQYDDYIIYGDSYYSYSQALDQILSSGDGAPDLYLCSSDTIKKDLANKEFQPLSVNSLGISYAELCEMYNYTLQMGCSDDHVIRALAWEINPGVVFYNKTVAMTTLGVMLPEDFAPYFQTWDSVIETARCVKEAGDYRAMASWEELLRPYSFSRNSAWIVDGNPYISPEMDTFFDIALVCDEENLTYNTEQWSPYWSEYAKNEKVLSYWGPMWLANNLEITDSNINPTAGDWGVVPGPTSWFYGGNWMMASKYCDKKASVAQIMRELTINPDNLYSMAYTDHISVNSISVMTDMAGSKDGEMQWLGGQNPFGILNETAKYVDAGYIVANEDKILYEFQSAVTSFVTGDFTTIAESEDNFSKVIIEMGYV